MRGASAQNVDLVTFDVMIKTRENDHFCDFSPMKVRLFFNCRENI